MSNNKGAIIMRLSDAEFNKLSDFIKRNYGIYLKDEKKVMIESRLSDLLIQKNITSFDQFHTMLMSDTVGDLKKELIVRVTTNYTYFMREEDTFSFFVQNVLPWIERVCKDRSLRIWSAGCSSGEEPYNLAMIIADYFASKNERWDKQLLASDISEKVLDIAQKAIYSTDKIECLPDGWKKRYLVKIDDNNYRFKDVIRNEVCFKKINLVEPFFPYKKKFHAIFCRNVMIYFDEDTRNDIIAKFVDNLEIGGFLLIGKTESVDRNLHNLEYIKPGIYRKKGTIYD